MKYNNTYNSIINQSYVDATDILNDKKLDCYILDTNKYSCDQMKKILINIMNMATR